MGIVYELYNHTQKEYTNVGRFPVNTKNWIESPLANFNMFIRRSFWFWSDKVELIGDSDDSYYDLRNIYKDVTDQAVKEYNERSEENELSYHDGHIPPILTTEQDVSNDINAPKSGEKEN